MEIYCNGIHQLIEIVKDEPIFGIGLQLAGAVDPDNFRQQLSLWASAR
jgi:hypothetical protein